MRKQQGVLLATLAMALPAALAVAFIVLFRNAALAQLAPGAVPAAVTRCVPTPLPPTSPPGPPTATPSRSQFGTARPPWLTMTPYPIKQTTDISPNVPDHAKLHVLVFHCDGTYEMFLIAGNEKDLPHQPGDVIIYGYVPDLMGHSVPAPTFGPFPTSTIRPTPVPAILTAGALTQAARPTAPPYPPPFTSTPTDARTGIPYPR